jgi:hypothetical protein
MEKRKIYLIVVGVLVTLGLLLFPKFAKKPDNDQGFGIFDLATPRVSSVVDLVPPDQPHLPELSGSDRVTDKSIDGPGWHNISQPITQPRTIRLQDKEMERLLVNKAATATFVKAIETPFGLVEAWSECLQHVCSGWVSVLKGSEEVISNARIMPLPVPKNVTIWFIDEVRVEPMHLLGPVSGSKEDRLMLVVSYSITEPPRPALGSIAHTYLVLFSLPGLQQIWMHETARSGLGILKEAEERAGRCSWQVAISVPDYARLLVHEKCIYKECLSQECYIKTPLTNYFAWDSDEKRFVKK